MRLVVKSLIGICLLTVAARAQTPTQIPTQFKHIIVIVQENRTPDNLFQGLCAPPFGTAADCSTTPGPGQYDIQTDKWLDKAVTGGTVDPGPVNLANTYDLDHSHTAFNAMCDLDPATGQCRMDGAAGISCRPQKGTTCPGDPQFKFVDNSTGILNPYLELATQFGWANHMLQTNQGPSFPAHQFLFGGTSAPSTQDDMEGIYASENMSSTLGGSGSHLAAGCTALSTTRVKLIMPDGTENTRIYPCFEHQTLGDLLDGGPINAPQPVSWEYYAPSPGSIWTAPNAIKHICESSGPGGVCTGQEWKNHVDVPGNGPGLQGSPDILKDIGSCSLQQVSWVIPSCQNSDHASCNDGGGPSWVASIVNAVAQASSCDNKAGYWNDTAIVVTWDDWGGWYDHEQPKILQSPFGDYQYGFRVPLLFVSAYTSQRYINNNLHDFGTILRFVEHNFGLGEGALKFADNRSDTDLTEFYDFTQPPRQPPSISSAKDASFFLRDKRKQLDPDDDE